MRVEILGITGGMVQPLATAYTGDGTTLNLRELVVNHDPCCEIRGELKGPTTPICLHDYDEIIVQVEGKVALIINL